MAKETIEKRVSDTILGKTKVVYIGQKRYEVASPTIGTLILISELLAQVPAIDELEKNGGNTAEILYSRAKDFGILPQIYAALILGSKRVNETEVRKRGLFRKKEEVKLFDILTAEIRDNVSPAVLAKMIPDLMKDLQLTDFFLLITFLREINLTKPRRVKKTTASGR